MPGWLVYWFSQPHQIPPFPAVIQPPEILATGGPVRWRRHLRAHPEGRLLLRTVTGGPSRDGETEDETTAQFGVTIQE